MSRSDVPRTDIPLLCVVRETSVDLGGRAFHAYDQLIIRPQGSSPDTTVNAMLCYQPVDNLPALLGGWLELGIFDLDLSCPTARSYCGAVDALLSPLDWRMD